MIDVYYCSRCHKETEPTLGYAGVQASCCEEAALLVAFCPSHPDKCKGCEMRDLTADEKSELNEELWRELRAEETPGQRAQRNWREGS